MSNSQQVQAETLKTLAFGSISGTYAKVGAAFSNPARMMTLINGTAGDMFFSDDGVNDKFFVKAGDSRPYPFCANHKGTDPLFAFAAGTQIWVKQSTAPVSGAVYVECIYGVNSASLNN